MIISLLNQKGGVGKTTICFNLAYKFKKSLLIDTDLQNSISHIINIRENLSHKQLPFDVISIHDKKDLKNKIPYLNSKYDFILIDGMPSVNELTETSILISNLIIIPMQTSGIDYWSSQELISIIEKAKKYNVNLVSAILFNKVIKNTNITKEFLNIAKKENWIIFDSVINQRVDLVKSITNGLSIFEYNNKSKSAEEINCLIKEIKSAIL